MSYVTNLLNRLVSLKFFLINSETKLDIDDGESLTLHGKRHPDFEYFQALYHLQSHLLLRHWGCLKHDEGEISHIHHMIQGV